MFTFEFQNSRDSKWSLSISSKIEQPMTRVFVGLKVLTVPPRSRDRRVRPVQFAVKQRYAELAFKAITHSSQFRASSAQVIAPYRHSLPYLTDFHPSTNIYWKFVRDRVDTSNLWCYEAKLGRCLLWAELISSDCNNRFSSVARLLIVELLIPPAHLSLGSFSSSPQELWWLHFLTALYSSSLGSVAQLVFIECSTLQCDIYCVTENRRLTDFSGTTVRHT